MNQPNEFPLVYFLFNDFITKKGIGSYLNKRINTSQTDIQEITSKFEEILNQSKLSEIKNKKNKLTSVKYNYLYFLNKNNVFFFGAILKSSQNSNENSLFELIEDIEHQGILKLVDKNKELTNVGKQNLIYLIEKYLNEKSRSNSSGDQSFEKNSYELENRDKILTVSNDVNEIKDNMKAGMKNLFSNIDMANELDSKAMRINNNSLLFKQDSENLRKQTQWRNRRFMIIIIVIGVIVGSYILYKIFK